MKKYSYFIVIKFNNILFLQCKCIKKYGGCLMAHKKVERKKELDRRRHRRAERLKERIREAKKAAKK